MLETHPQIWKCEIKEASSLAEALAMVNATQSKEFDAILLDLELPDTTGTQGVEAMSLTHPEIPIVVVTANTDLDVAVECLAKGAQDVVFKPVDIRDPVLPRATYYSIERHRWRLVLQKSLKIVTDRVDAIYDFLQKPQEVCKRMSIEDMSEKIEGLRAARRELAELTRESCT